MLLLCDGDAVTLVSSAVAARVMLGARRVVKTPSLPMAAAAIFVSRLGLVVKALGLTMNSGAGNFKTVLSLKAPSAIGTLISSFA